MFWQNQCCCEHLHDHQCGYWEIPGSLQTSPLLTGSDSDLQVRRVMKWRFCIVNGEECGMKCNKRGFKGKLHIIVLWSCAFKLQCSRIWKSLHIVHPVSNQTHVVDVSSTYPQTSLFSGPLSTSSPRWWWPWWSACPASWRWRLQGCVLTSGAAQRSVNTSSSESLTWI